MPMIFGNNTIGSMFLGPNKIGKAYLGENLVWLSDGSWGQMERHESVEGSITNRLLSSYDTEDHAYATFTNPTNAYTASNSTYTEIGMATGASAETYVYYKWDISDIPNNATINSLSCVVRGYVSNTTSANVAARNTQLFSGTTAKGSPVNVTTTITNREQTVGKWTRDELSNIRLRVYGRRGTNNTTSNYQMRLYFGKLSINYTYIKDYYAVKVKNHMTGLTVDPENAEYESGDTATLVFSGATSGFIVLDNGVDVTSQLEALGNNAVYTIPNIDCGHKIIVNEI